MAALVTQTGKLDLEVGQGATFNPTFTWKIDGAAVNLTGYTARMTARDTYGGTSWFSLTTENGGISLGGSAGTITLNLSASTSAALTAPAQGVYDLELVSGGGVVRRLLAGQVTVTPEVTT